MNDAPQQLPAQITDFPELAGGAMSPALQIMLNDKLFERAKMMAGYLAEAEGFVPKNIVGKPKVAFAVVCLAITWKLDPYAVARTCYTTPGGSIGFYGTLCQSILENSGKLQGPVRFQHYNAVKITPKNGDHYIVKSIDPRVQAAKEEGFKVEDVGDWQALVGKFKMAQGNSGKPYPVSAWSHEMEYGLGVRVIAQVRGEAEPRFIDFDLVQAFPRNSTLWATDPRTQICYTAIRRFSTVAAPGLFMGVPFDHDDAEALNHMTDITPPKPTGAGPAAPKRPQASDFDTSAPAAQPVQATTAQPQPEPEPEPEPAAEAEPPEYELVDETGVIDVTHKSAAGWIEDLLAASAPTPDGVFTATARGYLKNNAEAAKVIMAECDAPTWVAKLMERYATADKPPDQPKPAAAEPAQPATEVQSVEEPKTEAKPMVMPMTERQRPDGAKYLIAIQDEILLATEVEHIDRLLERETPNIAKMARGTQSSITMFAEKAKLEIRKKAPA